MISWLFEIDTLKLSTKEVSWSGNDYDPVIIASSFSGIKMRWNISGNGLIAPNDVNFAVSNPDATYSISDFEDKFCTIRLIIDGSEIRTWKMKIKRAVSYYGKIDCVCVDFLQDYLVGDYPKTKAPKELWPSDDGDVDDNYCVPVVFGTAYIPIRSVNTGTDRYYILGPSSPTYTISEVQSPRSWPNSSTWTSASYTMTQSTNSGYQLLEPIIADSDDDGTADATGLWRYGTTFYDMLCKFSRDDTSALTNPAEWIEYILEDFGVASGDLDSTSFSAAETAYDNDSISFNGGFWMKESREKILSNLLAQTDSFIICSDSVKLYRFSKTSQETITNMLLKSFSSAPLTKSENDSGRVHWPEASVPQDKLTGKAIVPITDGGATDNPSSEILECRFLVDQSQNAQQAGSLYFQKKYGQQQRYNFSTTLTDLTNKGTLSPGHVITVNNTLYGGNNDMIITDMKIGSDLKVEFTGVVL